MTKQSLPAEEVLEAIFDAHDLLNDEIVADLVSYLVDGGAPDGIVVLFKMAVESWLLMLRAQTVQAVMVVSMADEPDALGELMDGLQ